MEKIKKFLNIYLVLFVMICTIPINSIFADEFDDVDDINTDDVVDYSNDINNLQNQINDINDNISNEIQPLLKSLSNPTVSGNYGRAIDLSFFNNISNDFLIKSLYDYYDSYDFIVGRNISAGLRLYFFNINNINTISFDTENNRYLIKVNVWDVFNPNGSITYNSTYNETFYFYLDRYELGTPFNHYVWFKFTYNDDNFYFKPFKFDVNADVNDYTFTSGIYGYYYPNQVINVSYTGDADTFYGWYDTDLQQTISKNPTYVFSINKDTDLKLITNDEYVDIMLGLTDDNNFKQLIEIVTIIFAFVVLLVFKSLVWGV